MLEIARHGLNLIRGLVYEFQPEVPYAGVEPGIEMLARLLSLCPKHGIPASNVGHHGVRAALLVTNLDAMLLARMSTISEVGALRQEAAEDAVLGVENR